MTANPTESVLTDPTPNGHDGPLLEVEDLFVEFGTGDGVGKVLSGVSYHVDDGETLAVLGAPGSGKRGTAQTGMGILDTPPAHVPGGSIRFRGQGLLSQSAEKRRQLRGDGIAMVC